MQGEQTDRNAIEVLASSHPPTKVLLESEITCKVCFQNEIRYILSIKGRKYAPDGSFDLYQCQNCELVFIHPQPDIASLKAYYPQSYLPHTPPKRNMVYSSKRSVPALRRWVFGNLDPKDKTLSQAWRRFLVNLYHRLSYRSLPASHWPARLLDIGSGVGSYLSLVKNLGWDAVGVEPNLRAAQYARSNYGVRIESCSFEEFTYPEKSFDVITMWHSLEHFTDPRSVVDKVNVLLKPEGVFMIGLPNHSSLDRRIFKDYWNGYEIPLHLYHFSPKSIQALLVRAGFECQTIVHTIRPLDAMKSMQAFFEKRFHLQTKGLAKVFLFFPALLLSLVSAGLKQSSIIKVSAYKNNARPSQLT